MRRITNGRATPPLGFHCDHWRRLARGHATVAMSVFVAAFALACAVYVGGVVYVFQRLTPCERHLQAWEQDPVGCHAPWLDDGVRRGR